MADERIDILIEARENVAGAVAAAIGKLEGLNAAADRASEKMRRLGADNEDTANKMRRDLLKAVNETSAALRGQESDIDRVSRAARGMEQRTGDLAEAWRHNREEADKASVTYQQQTAKVKELAEEHEKLQRKVAQAKSPSWVTNYSNQLADVEKRLQNATKRQAEAREATERYTNTVKDQGQELRNLNDQQQERVTLLEREQKQMDRNVQAYRRAGQEAAKLKKDMDELNRRPDASPAQRSFLANQFEKARAEMAAFKRDMERSRDNIVNLRFGVDMSGARRAKAEADVMKAQLGDDITANLDLDIGGFLAQAAMAESVKALLGKDVHVNIEADSSGVNNALSSINKAIQENRHSIAQFDNQIRGMLAFMAVGLAQPLISTLVALGGHLVSVGSSAIMAGGAIGVGLTSGIAQALPMVGLLIGAFTRVASVMEAVQQHTLMLKQKNAQQMQGTQDNTSATNTLAGAMDGLASAQQGVIDAQDRLAEAQQNLTRARFEARRELQDLILAEKDAQLAAQGAALSQEEAQRALQRAVATGDVAGVSSASLAVRQAGIDRRRAEIEARRTSQDLRLQQAGSPLAPDQSVEQAQQQVEDARRGIEEAQQQVVAARRAIDSAKASMNQANNDVVAAQANLQFFLSQLSKAELRLYHAIMDIRRTFKQEWGGVTDSLVGSFALALESVNRMMKDPEVIRSAEKLADSMSTQMDRITKEFTGDKWSEFWQTMAGAAGRNLRPITRDFLTLSNTFRRIADAGRPLFREMIQLVHEAVEDFDTFVGRGKDLRDFFDEMGKHLEAWWNLGRAVLRLIVVLIGSSAKEGLHSVRSLTEAVQEAATWIEEHGKKMQNFWDGTRRVISVLAEVILALGEEILKSFSPKSVEALGDMIRRVFIPALGSAIRFMGQMFILLEKLSRNESVAFLLKFAIGASIAAKVLKTLGGLFLSLFGGLLRFGGAVGTVAGSFEKFGNLLTRTFPKVAIFVESMGGWRAVLLRVVGPIGLIAGAIIFLLDKFGLLDDIWEAFKRGFETIVDAVKPSVEDLMDAFERLSKSLSGSSGGLGAVLKWLFTTVVKGLVIPAIEIMANIIGKTLGGALDVVAGVINVIADVLMGKWDKIPGHLKDIWDGLVRVVTAGGTAIADFLEDKFGVIGKILTAPFRLFKSVLEGLGDFFKSVFGGVIDIISGLIEGDFSKVWGGIKDVLLAPFKLIKDVLVDLVNTIIDIINPVLDAVGIGRIDPVGSGDNDRTKNPRTYERRYNKATGGRIGFASGGGIASGITRQALSNTFGPLGGLLGGGVADLAADALDALPSASGYGMPGVFADLPGNLLAAVRDFLISAAGGGIGDFFGGIGDFFGGIFAGGGHVAGPGGVDVIPANLTRGEFVVTPHGESILESVTGVPGILNWLGRRQRPAQGFAVGGRAGGGSAADAVGGDPNTDVNVGDLADSVKKIVTALRRFSRNGAQEWNDAWDQIQDRTRRGGRYISNLFTRLGKDVADSISDMTKDVERDFEKMVNRVVRDLQRMSKAAKVEGKDFADFIKDAMQTADNATYKGLSYIVDATNKGLKAFDEKPIEINVARPQGRAVGGFIGQPGERGGDKELALLGRGEAVLNWAHQKVVEPAMRAYYGAGLADMFDRTSAMHGQGAPGGYASGGYTGPGHSGAGFTPVWNLAQSKFGMTNYTGFDGHSQMTSSGNISDHWLHRALDMSDGGILTPAMDALSNFFKSKVPQIVKQLIWRNQDQFTGYPIGGHEDHVHLAMPDQYAFNETVTAKILSAAQKGLDFSSLLKGGTLEAGTQLWKNIPEVVAKGTQGPLLDIVNSSLSKLRESANAYGQAIAEAMGGDLLGPIMGTHKLPPTFDAINRKFTPHWSPDFSGETLPFNLVAALAEWAGMPGVTFAQIAQGESGLRPGAAGVDPGGASKGYGLWAITSPFNDATVARYGGYSNMWNPVLNAQAAQDIYETQGTGAWYGTSFVTDWNTHYKGEIPEAPEKKAVGGIVGMHRQQGSEVPVIAHAGEWILNAMQQSKLANMMGLPVHALKGMLGFSGGPNQFADGGEIDSTGSNWLDAFIEKFMKSFKKVFGGDPTLQTNRFGDFAATLGATQLAVRDWLEQLTGGEGHGGLVEFGKRPKNTKATDDLNRAINEAEDTMKGITKVISKLPDTFKEGGKELNDNIRNAFEGLTGDGGVLDRLSEQFDEMVSVMETQVTKMQIAVKNHGSKIIGRATQGIKVIERELSNLRDQLDLLIGERGILQDAMKKAQRALRVAQRENDKEAAQTARAAISNISIRLRDINAEIAAMQMSILEKMEERQQQLLDDISEDADKLLSGMAGKRGRKTLGIDIRQRIQEALGFTGRLDDLAQDRIDVLEEQKKDLRALLKRARKRGNTELAQEIESQIADLQASIVEASAQLIADTQSQIETAAGHREAGVDIQNRLADFFTSFGQGAKGAQVRAGALATQRSSLTTQLQEMQALVASAIAQGFGPEVVLPLQESVADLQMQLLENVQAMYENTIALRQASIDAILNRQTFLGGVTDALKGITETMGTITGTVNTPQLVQIVTAALASLTSAGSGLRGQLATMTGDLSSLLSPQAMQALMMLSNPDLHGEDFVTAALGLPLNDIIDSLGGPDSPLSQQFQALIQAIIDNEAAVQANTEELQSIQQQSNIQQFTSTAWQWFRQAMFTGMGGLMPNLAAGTPFFADGGDMQYDGLAYLHSGETVVPARFAQYVKQMMLAGQMAGRMSTGGVPAADLAMGFATGQAATIGGAMAGQFNGSNSEYAKLRQALLHQQQHIETHIHGAPASDARHVTDTIAFKAKIPV